MKSHIQILLLVLLMPALAIAAPIPDIAGSEWRLKYTAPSGKKRNYRLVFEPDGSASYSNSTGNHSWEQMGRDISFSLNDGYVTYQGRLSGNALIRGTAHNVKGKSWSWRAERSDRPRSTGYGSLEGTVWRIEYQVPGGKFRSYTMGFEPGGLLDNNHPNESTPANDFWEQDGRQVTLRINDDFVTYRGRRVSPDQMKGTARNVKGKSWSWVAFLESGGDAYGADAGGPDRGDYDPNAVQGE